MGFCRVIRDFETMVRLGASQAGTGCFATCSEDLIHREGKMCGNAPGTVTTKASRRDACARALRTAQPLYRSVITLARPPRATQVGASVPGALGDGLAAPLQSTMLILCTAPERTMRFGGKTLCTVRNRCSFPRPRR